MMEHEVKILEVNKVQIEKKLKKLGAKKIFSGLLEIYYFDYPGKKLMNNNKVLRLRKQGKKQTVLTFKIKGNHKECKLMHELETEVSNFKEMYEILILLGFID